MRSFRLDPYLWVHLAGLAMLPVLFSGCLLGLAVGEPLLSVWIEMGVLVGLGVAPILWMQLQRPFYIFSLVFVAIRPESLSDERLRLLRLFKTPSLKVISAIAPIPLVWVLWQIYVLAPVASEITPLTGLGRLGGLLVAAFCFGLCNLFFQVPVSVVRVMAATSEQLAKIPPYEPSQIETNFSAWGLWVDQILPDLVLPNRGETPDQPPLSEEVASADTSLSPEPLDELRVDTSDLGDSGFDNDLDDDLDVDDALDLESGTSIDPSPIESDRATDLALAQEADESALAPLVDTLSEAKEEVLVDAESEVSSLPMEATGDVQSNSDGGEEDWGEASEIPAAESQAGADVGESIAEVESATDGENPNAALILETDTEDSPTPSQPGEGDTPDAQVLVDPAVGNKDDGLEVLQGDVTLEAPLEVEAAETEDGAASA